MTNMRIMMGPFTVGDEMLSRDVFRRVALNFGTLPRDYMPLEPILARRINPRLSFPRRCMANLRNAQGGGVRPGETPHGACSRIRLACHRNRLRRDSTTLRSLSVRLSWRSLSQSLQFALSSLSLWALQTPYEIMNPY